MQGETGHPGIDWATLLLICGRRYLVLLLHHQARAYERPLYA